MNIGITCYPTVGGSGVIATELGKLLADRGHEIHFISSSLPFRLNKINPNIYYHPVKVNEYALFQYPPYDIALSSKMAEVAKREKLDILHVHYAIPHAVCAILAKQMSGLDFKVVTTLHGTDITVLSSDPSLTEAIKFGIEQSDRVTAVSEALAQQTNQRIKTKQQINVVANFIDDRIFKKIDAEYLKQQYGIKPEEKVLIHVSNFRPVKRVADVLFVFRNIVEHLPAKLLLVGEGPEISLICELANKLNISEHVFFLGNQENLAELYSISDLMLLLSAEESFGLVLLEAMACGVPCIGTNVGGIPEVIADGKTGYLVDVGHIKTITEKSLHILQNDHMHEKFAKEAVRLANERFSATAIVDQYEKIYQHLLTER